MQCLIGAWQNSVEVPGSTRATPFEYTDSEGKIAIICSEDVNEYLQSISGEPFTAKDFRTWAGTVLADIALSQMEEVDSKAAAKKNVITAVEAVDACWEYRCHMPRAISIRRSSLNR